MVFLSPGNFEKALKEADADCIFLDTENPSSDFIKIAGPEKFIFITKYPSDVTCDLKASITQDEEPKPESVASSQLQKNVSETPKELL